jgi:hypothetical protein
MYRQARDRQTCRQSARGAANMHDPYVNNATTNVPAVVRAPRAFVARVSSNERSIRNNRTPRAFT